MHEEAIKEYPRKIKRTVRSLNNFLAKRRHKRKAGKTSAPKGGRYGMTDSAGGHSFFRTPKIGRD